MTSLLIGNTSLDSASPSYNPQSIDQIALGATKTVINNLFTCSADSTVTIATLTGAGVIRNLQMTHTNAADAETGLLQVFVDGEATPSISVEWGTLFGLQADAFTNSAGQLISTRHTSSSITGSTYPGSSSGALNFPIPYSDGVVIKLYARANTGNMFAAIQYQPGAIAGYTDRWRLRSACTPFATPIGGIEHTVVPFFDIPNMAGVLAWFSVAIGAASDYTYLERPWDVLVDGEGSPSYHGNSEDWFNSGFYFGGMTHFSSPNSMVTAANLSDHGLAAGIDLLNETGGIKFTSELAMQYGRTTETKTGSDLDDTNFSLGYVALFYVDTNQPFAPSAPQAVSAGSGSSSAVVAWIEPASPGSSPITGYTVTATAAGHTTVSTSVSATTFSATLSGLTDGVTYTISVTATNAVGETSATNTVIPGATYDSTVLASSPVGYWKLGEASGAIAADSSGNGNNGTYTGVTLGLAGATSDGATAAEFLGRSTASYVSIPSATVLQVAAPFTFEAFLYFDSSYSMLDASILSKSADGSYADSDFIWQGSGTNITPLELVTKNATVATAETSTPTSNTWHHCAVTYDGTTVKYYLDGAADGSVSFSTPTQASNGQLTIGSWLNDLAATFGGRIMKVAIFDTALSAATIATHYAAR